MALQDGKQAHIPKMLEQLGLVTVIAEYFLIVKP